MAPDPVKMTAYNLPDPTHMRDREPFEKQHFPDLQVVHASFEDTNLWIAERIKRRNRHARRHNLLSSLKLNHTRKPLTTAPLPEGRPFNWLRDFPRPGGVPIRAPARPGAMVRPPALYAR